MIELIEVTKLYNGQAVPAVDNLSLKVGKGETCVFVGPSGCGKSTTLRIINRMIEPSLGTILIDNKDVKASDPDKLRMNIGYVIQQIGLLPHRTVAENIAIVPRLHGWNKQKINQRVDELLNLIGLDPELTRNKYPYQLSGGQMQRVGVARAMAVDPPIMLMDEPFGAVDPLARNHLQDEFLRLQKKMKKTICFVTHDINEAIKMGDKIAIFDQGKLLQHGTPQEILSKPANDFVSDFIGYDRIVKKLSLFQVKELTRYQRCVFRENELPNLGERIKAEDAEAYFLVDADGQAAGFVTREEFVQQVITSGDTQALEKIRQLALSRKNAFVRDTALLRDALSLMLELGTEYLGVWESGELAGLITLGDIRKHSCRKGGE
ncbi:ABC transporter ATP-binding protein [Sporomusa termitida]|uniref:Quaternary amine transport ATP-binding protein n=1 Tax=Sporomusa termitida TaxID=2377 RepID=A0A517DPP5_9FIRM|nr:ABC transporter ATP-binding protein [Sporomusa termitida]QDR79277.1 Osmoprotectant import ATP-binding protein OsmV [Sporomusa termitida]